MKKKTIRKLSITLVVLLVIVGAGFYGWQRLYKYMIPNEPGTPLYLERVEGLPEVNENLFINVQNTLLDNEIVESASIRVQGPIIYTDVVVVDDATLELVEEAFSTYFDSYSSVVLEAYDFQFIVQKENEVALEDGKLYFPHFGSKSSQVQSNKITWIERYEYLDTITVEEDTEEESDTEAESSND